MISYCIYFESKEYKTPFQIQKEVYENNLWRLIYMNDVKTLKKEPKQVKELSATYFNNTKNAFS